MALTPYSRRLNLTRDQFATFLKDHEQIRQFELLFTTVDEIAPDVVQAATILAGNADTKAIQALGMILALAQDAAVGESISNVKATQALDQIAILGQETSVGIALAENKANQALALLAQLATAVDGLQMVPPPREFKRARYGQFFDTTTQVATVINTATTVTFNTTDISNGVFIGSPTSRIVVDTEGIYNFQVSMQFDSTGGSNHDVWVWFRKNGTNIPNSAMYLNIQNNQSEVLQAFNLLVSMKALDYLEVMWEVGNLNAQMAAFAASGVHPAIPSIILTATNNVQGVQ
jgi:hypothetical protein